MILKCGHKKGTTVVDSRPTDFWIRRRRECVVCQTRYTTIEFPLPFKGEEVPSAIIQRVFRIPELRKNIDKLIGLLAKLNSDLPV